VLVMANHPRPATDHRGHHGAMHDQQRDAVDRIDGAAACEREPRSRLDGPAAVRKGRRTRRSGSDNDGKVSTPTAPSENTPGPAPGIADGCRASGYPAG